MPIKPKRYDVESNLYHSFNRKKESSLQGAPQATTSRQKESILVIQLKELTCSYIINSITIKDFTKLYWVTPTIDKKLKLTKKASLEYLKSFNRSNKLLVSILEEGIKKSYHNNLLLFLNQKELEFYQSLSNEGVYLTKVRNYHNLSWFIKQYLLKELTKPTHFLTKVFFNPDQQRIYLKKVKHLINSFTNQQTQQYNSKYWQAHKEIINQKRRAKYHLTKIKKISCENVSNIPSILFSKIKFTHFSRTIKGDIDSWLGYPLNNQKNTNLFSLILNNHSPPFWDDS